LVSKLITFVVSLNNKIKLVYLEVFAPVSTPKF
jgi:hypothetical protein